MPDDPTRNPFARLHLGLVSTVYNAGGAILADIARAGRLDPLRDLRGIHLAGIDLSGWDLRSVDLGNVDLRGTRLRHATIDCTTLIGPMSDIDAEDVEAVHAALDRPLELRALKPGTIICDAPGAPQLAFVPKGEFVMGMPNGEGKAEGLNDDWGEWSRPLTPVTFEREFWIGRFPVTVGEFRLFAMDSGRKAGSKWDKVGFQAENRDDHPVVEVPWNDAQAYVGWLAKKTGKPYRLPTEAEWEYACRAGTKTARYWGEAWGEGATYAHVSEGSLDGTIPVGRLRPNAWGLHDTLGNEWEWVQDEWTPDLKSQPRDGLAKGSAKGTNLGRVLRGGSWYIITRFARAGDRNLVDWDLARGRSSWAGFRVARTPCRQSRCDHGRIGSAKG